MQQLHCFLQAYVTIWYHFMSCRITGRQHLYQFWEACVTIWDHFMSSRITGIQHVYQFVRAYVTIWDHFMSSRITGMQRLYRFLRAYGLSVQCRHCCWLWGAVGRNVIRINSAYSTCTLRVVGASLGLLRGRGPLNSLGLWPSGASGSYILKPVSSELAERS